MKKTVLVIGSGGREHALAWKLSHSPSVGKVYCAPGNGGIAAHAECVALASPERIIAFCREQAVDLVVIGPEQPLVDGLADQLRAANIRTFGPSAAAARLEASKGFTKDLCRACGIPTAAYETFTDAPAAKAYLKGKPYPIVVKADGLAAGKGVVIAQDPREAEAAVDAMFAAGQSVVIEECLGGEEVSFFALCDGETVIPFGHAQDHKRAYDGDKGPNTGGMGAYAPAPRMTPALEAEVMQRIILPTVRAMREQGIPFQGVLFAGLMLTREGPKLLEYNARFGDPETQVLMRRLESDLYAVLAACADGKLAQADIRFGAQAALCVVMAAQGYPGSYQKGSVIHGLDRAEALPGVIVFHAGTERRGSDILAVGGRVLGVTAIGDTIAQAQASAYRAVDAIDWPEGFCRRDIGRLAVKAA